MITFLTVTSATVLDFRRWGAVDHVSEFGVSGVIQFDALLGLPYGESSVFVCVLMSLPVLLFHPQTILELRSADRPLDILEIGYLLGIFILPASLNTGVFFQL